MSIVTSETVGLDGARGKGGELSLAQAGFLPSCYQAVNWSLPYSPLPALCYVVVDQNLGTLIQKIPFLLSDVLREHCVAVVQAKPGV